MELKFPNSISQTKKYIRNGKNAQIILNKLTKRTSYDKISLISARDCKSVFIKKIV